MDANPPPSAPDLSPQHRRDLCTTVRELITLNACLAADHVALVGPETGIQRSYAELHSRIEDMADRLNYYGLNKGDCVSFLLDNGVATVELMLATMVAGFRCAPLNPAAGATQLAYVFNHSESTIVFVCTAHEPLLAELLAGIDRSVTVIPTCVNDGPHWPPSPDNEKPSQPIPIEAGDDALLMYTSGTTGDPKGVLLTHRNVIAGGRNVAIAHDLNNTDRALCVLPLCHINAQIVSVLGVLASGGAVVVPHRFSGSRFWHWIADHRCTWFSVVPTIIARLLQATDDPATLSAATRWLRFGRSASAPLPPALHQHFEQRFGIRIIETMGLTETAAPILSNPMPPQQARFGSPGLAVGNQVRIVGRDGNQQPPGGEGQIVVRGGNVMRGYLKNPTATAAVLDDQGWFQTGDLGYMDQDGYVFVSGRLKELIIKGGENIAPREIDDVLYSHPSVVEAGVVGLADATYGEVVVAGVVVNCDPGTYLESALIAYCVERVGAFKAPQAIYFLPSLPKGPSGKIQRRKLIALIQSQGNNTSQSDNTS